MINNKGVLYIVTMYRWGDRDGHSYVLGIYTKKNAAIKAAECESEYRGGKYAPEVLEMKPNINIWDDDPKTIIVLLSRLHKVAENRSELSD